MVANLGFYFVSLKMFQVNVLRYSKISIKFRVFFSGYKCTKLRGTVLEVPASSLLCCSLSSISLLLLQPQLYYTLDSGQMASGNKNYLQNLLSYPCEYQWHWEWQRKKEVGCRKGTELFQKWSFLFIHL